MRTKPARGFSSKIAGKQSVLHQEITEPRSALRRAARELELACGAGTESRLVIYGDEPVLARLLPLLGADARGRLVGAFSRQSVSYPAYV